MTSMVSRFLLTDYLSLSITSVATFALIAAVFWTILFFYYNRNYWKKRGIPGPESSLFTGHLNEMSSFEKPSVFQLHEWTKKYGPVYGIQQGLMNILVTSDPEFLYEVFVKKFDYFHGRKVPPLAGDVDTSPRIHLFNARGPRWKRLRTISNPIFSTNNLKKILPTMNDSALKMTELIDKQLSHSDEDKCFNIHPYFHEYTMDVISRVAMGQKDSQQFDNYRVELAKNFLEKVASNPWLYVSHLLPHWLLPLYRKIVMLKAAIFGGEFVALFSSLDKEVKLRRKEREVEERERPQKGEGDESNHADEQKKKRLDFIDLFLDAESTDTEALATVSLIEGGTFDKTSIKVLKKLTPIEVTAQLFLFILAGFDTTANSLALTCYYLARHPDVQKKLHEEIDEIFGDSPSDSDEFEPTYEQLHRMNYAEAMMKETLRLQPIAAFALARQCAKTVKIGEHLIEAGTYVQADVIGLQRNKELWGPDADEFRPERWLDGSATAAEDGKLRWMPFGAGPRVCLGMRMAIIEEKNALAHIFRRYAIHAPNEPEKLKLVGGAVMNPVAVTVKLTPR